MIMKVKQFPHFHFISLSEVSCFYTSYHFGFEVTLFANYLCYLLNKIFILSKAL